jgi:DNA-binding NtrC family response regulator
MTKSVLIVGDTPRWIEAVKTALPQDVHVHTATDYIGALGVLFLEERQFDLYITGNKLPELQDGIRILTEVRADGMTEPFIIFSDHITDETTVVAKELKATLIPHSTGLRYLEETLLDTL